MAERQYFVTDAGATFYRTRMLSAGDPIRLNGPNARLQLKLGNVTAKKPAKAKPEPVSAPPPTPAPAPEAVKAPKAPRAPRKKKASE